LKYGNIARRHSALTRESGQIDNTSDDDDDDDDNDNNNSSFILPNTV